MCAYTKKAWEPVPVARSATQGSRIAHHCPNEQRIAEEPHGQYQQQHATHQGVQHLPSGIKFQVFLVSRAYTGDAHQQERHHLAIHQVAVMVDEPLLDAVVQVAHHTAKTVYRSWVYGILKELHQHGYVDDRPEYLVKSL